MSGYLSEFKFSSPTISAEVYGKVYPFSTYPTSTLSYLKVTQPNYSVELGGSFDLNLNSGSVNTIKLSYGNQSLSINSTNFDIAKYTNSQFDLNYLYSLALTGNDLITGSSGNEYLNGYAGNDSINSGAGSDSIDGGLGTDQTTFNNPFSSYTITYGTNKVFKVAGPEGTDQVINVEYFTFKDGTLPTDAIRTFDALNYVASYGDLIRAFGTNTDAAESHFITAGYREGRYAHFDAAQYLSNYSDLQHAFGNDLDAATNHYIRNGFSEGRTDMVIDIQVVGNAIPQTHETHF